MENIQVNGQRILGPPKNWSGPPPPHGTEVFIKNIPEKIMENELCEVFATVGEIYEVRVPIYWNGLNRGYAFVRYTKTEYVNAAIRHLDKLQNRIGCCIKLERSIDNNRLFLSAVPNYKTGREILNDLKEVVDNVKKVYVYPSLEDPSLYRGYAFVEFVTHRDAAIAKRILTPEVCSNLFEKKCIAAWANPLPQLFDGVLEKISILFMRNIPQNISTSTLKQTVELVAGFTLERIKRLNDIAFLTFKNHHQAKLALERIKKNSYFMEKGSLEVEWAVPRELGRPKASSELKLQCGTKVDKNKMDSTKLLVEETWRNGLQSISQESRSLSCVSDFTELQKNIFSPSERVDRTIRNLVEDMKKKNFSPKDFINNNLIPFENEPNKSDNGFFEGGSHFAAAEEIARRSRLENWFENLNLYLESTPPSNSCGSPSDPTSFDLILPTRQKIAGMKFRKS